MLKELLENMGDHISRKKEFILASACTHTHTHLRIPTWGFQAIKRRNEGNLKSTQIVPHVQ